MKPTIRKYVSITVLVSFLLTALPLIVPAEDNLGTLNGFVYSDDGKNPLHEAVVLIRETVTLKEFKSVKTEKNGAYKIENILPGTYAVGIQYKGNDYNVDVLLQIKPKKQIACFTLPRDIAKPGYAVRCNSPKCFFITPCGWALIGGVTAGITYGIIKITEEETSPTGN